MLPHVRTGHGMSDHAQSGADCRIPARSGHLMDPEADLPDIRHSCFSCHPLLMNPESIPDERIIDWFMMQFCIIQQAEYVLREHPRIPAQLSLGRCLICLIQLDS